jgi:hypothetical protein
VCLFEAPHPRPWFSWSVQYELHTFSGISRAPYSLLPQCNKDMFVDMIRVKRCTVVRCTDFWIVFYFVYILWLGSQPCPPRAATMVPAVRYPGPQWNNVPSQQVAEAHFQKRDLPSIVNVADLSRCIANPGSCHFHA